MFKNIFLASELTGLYSDFLGQTGHKKVRTYTAQQVNRLAGGTISQKVNFH